MLVASRLGVAPIYKQLRAFKTAEKRTTAIIGFRSRDFVSWEEQFDRFDR